MILPQDHKPITQSSWTESSEKIKILRSPAYCYLLPQKVYLDVLFPRPCVISPDNLAFYSHLCLNTTEASYAVIIQNGQK